MFKCPVKVGRVTSEFGWRDIGRGKEWHQGVDLAGPKPGDKVPIYAAADGVVKREGPLSTYGNRVLLQHTINGKIYETNYAHLSFISVKGGQRVKQGQQIGIMGNTGGSFGVHLHFEIHNGLYKPGQPNAVNPMKYISLDDWKALGQETEKPKPVEKDDDETMKFSNETTKNTIRDHVKQMIKNNHIDSSWLTKFDNNTMTNGDYEALKLISEQKKVEEAKAKK